MRVVVDKDSDLEAKDIIKMVRQWTELTQKDFCQVMNYSLRTIQSYEEGFRKCTFDTFLDLAQKLGLTITIEKTDSIDLSPFKISNNRNKLKQNKKAKNMVNS